MRSAGTAVPATDSANNVSTADVVGSKLDRTYNGGDSIFAEVHTLGDHVHKSQKVYPTLAAGVTLTSAAGAYTLGALAEIMPADTESDYFDVHWINIEVTDTNGIYELVLYYGAGDTEYARIRFPRSAVFQGAGGIRVQGPVIAGTNRIRAAVAHSAGGAATCVVTIGYHTY